jgi:transcriptional regulator with XRE-family HTH domain
MAESNIKAWELGDRLRGIRKNKGLTAKELAEKSGIAEKTIYRIENGEVKDPKLSSIKPLILALECTSDELIFDSKDYISLGALKQVMFNLSELPEHELEPIITVIRSYCLANTLTKNLHEHLVPVEGN